MDKIERFKELVRAHDLTYQYSDDHRYWSRGSRQYSEIRTLAKEIGMEIAMEIWNKEVDRKLREDSREQFYWK